MNSPAPGQVVVKKGMGLVTSFFVIIGVCCLCCCLSSMWSTAKGVSAVSSAVKNLPKKETAGPRIKDMVVTNMDTSTVLSASKEEQTNDKYALASTKPMKIDIYSDCQCTSLVKKIEVDVNDPNAKLEGEVGSVTFGSDVHPRCVRIEGGVHVTEYRHLARGKTDEGEPWEHVEVVGEIIPSGDGVAQIKIGCEENQTNVEDVSLQFKWKKIN